MKSFINIAFSGGRKGRNGGSMDILLGIILLLFGLLIVWLYAIAPQMRNRPDMLHLTEFDYAHRGLYNHEKDIPENSLMAFSKAVEAGFGVELDVQLTADNEVVVVHDFHLMRLCGQDVNVGDVTLEELQSFPLMGTEERIPTLVEALRVIGESIPVMVEIKSESDYNLLCPQVWNIMSEYGGSYSIQSFHPLVVRWFKDHQPQVIRGQLMEKLKQSEEITNMHAFLGRHLFSNFLTRPNFESYNYLDRASASMWLAKNLLGMPEVSWTVTDPETYDKLKKKGCTIIFEGFEPISQSSKFKAKISELDPALAPIASKPLPENIANE